MPEGETKEMCEEHKLIMKKEMARSSNRNLALVRELMGVTFAYRGEMLIKEVIPVSQLVTDYPALKSPSGVS